jgi:signal peptide peptidase SppA
MQYLKQAFYNTPWALMPDKLAEISEFIQLRSDGIRFTAEEVEQRVGALHKPVSGVNGGVSVIPIFGTISQRMGMVEAMSGGTSTETLGRQIKEAANDESVGKILLNIDSPGGSVYGIQEVSKIINEAKEIKPVIAIANSLAASAAYWIGSSATEFYSTQGGEVGSIGVLTAHTDMSEALESEGYKTTIISAGKYKVEGNPYEPLEDEALTAIQKRVDEYYDDFVGAVAKNRGTTKAEVKGGYGQGRVLGAKEAKQENMIDGIMSFDDLISKLTKRSRSRANANRASLLERI